MFKKQQRGSVRIFRGFLMGIVSLALLSMNGFAAEVQRGKETEQPTGNQQQEKMSLQEGWRASKIIDYPIFTYKSEGFEEYYYSPPPPYGSFAFPPPGYQGYFPYGQTGT